MPKIRHTEPIYYPENTLYIQWISNKYGNFTKNKCYVAHACFQNVGNKQYTNFHITDDDGDSYTLNNKDCGKKFRFLSKQEFNAIECQQN